MLDSLSELQLHPVFVLLSAVALVVLQWSIYFLRSSRKVKSTRLKQIKAPYLCYSLSIFGWIVSNAYFYSPLLVGLGEDAAIAVGLIANILSYSAFASAYLVCLMLAKPWTFKLETTLLSLVSALIVIANIVNYQMIEGVVIAKAGDFAIQFGHSTSYFFAAVLCVIFLSFRCVIHYSRNAKPIQHIKSLYMLFGISVFMISTITIHVFVPMIFDDFSLVWLPPALSISEMMLMGYAIVTSRFYSTRHILYRFISLMTVIAAIALPVLFVIETTDSKSIVTIVVLVILVTGSSWRKLSSFAKAVSSKLMFRNAQSPQQQIYNLADEFQKSADKPLKQVAEILGIDQDSFQLVSNIQDEPLFTNHITNSNSILVFEEIEDSLPELHSQQETLSMLELYREMDAKNISMVLPIFDKANAVSHLLIARQKHDGRMFFGEEIEALQSVLRKAQGYINADLKIKQSQALANSIAHEMRNPLAQAQLEFEYIEQINKASNLHSALDNHLYKGKQAVHRGKQLIDIILREVNDSSLALEPSEPALIAASIQSTVDLYGFEHSNHRERVLLSLQQDFVAKINDTLFNFVLFNLLRNAIYYFDSYPESKIEIRTEKGQYENYVVFRDTGPGIPDNLLARIFDDFFSHNKSGGSGLGLGYCQRVMVSFGGSISCRSELGKFTEFTLTFQATNISVSQVTKTEQDPKLVKASQPKPSSTNPQPLAFEVRPSHMIMVVDDKEIQRTLVKLYLQQLGYGVILANNGKVAIDILQNNPIDLVFMDIQMPVMDGFEAASIIKRSFPTIPIIALSGESGEKDLQRISELMDGRLSKPTTKEALNTIIESTLKEPAHS